MKIRYDFLGDKLDLSRFQKQSVIHIGRMRQLVYDFYFKDYKMIIEIITPDDSNIHKLIISLFDIKYNNSEIIMNSISPTNDIRFKEFKNIINLFEINNKLAYLDSNNANNTVEEICSLIKILFKINNLKVFI